MPPKKYHTHSKRRQVPTTSAEFFSAAIEYEEAGDRWSAGDAKKALRFWVRAAEAYESSLNLALDFDAAYNLARGVLQAHYRALELARDGGGRVDVLFNTAQVHTAVAEVLERGGSGDGGEAGEAVAHLLKARDMFAECLRWQRGVFESYSEPALVGQGMGMRMGIGMGAGDGTGEDEDEDMEMGGVELGEERREEGEEYAVIQEPVTEGVIADTLVELLKTLSTLLPLLPDPRKAAASASELLQQLHLLHASLPSRQTELSIASAVTQCAIAESAHRVSPSPSSLSTWESTLTSAFSPTWPWPHSPEALCAKSDCHISLASTVPAAAWRHYALSSQALAAAASLDGGKTARIHVARGDTELLRSRTEACTPETRAVLRRNAGVFYRGAVRLVGEREGKTKREAEVKELAVRVEDGVEEAGGIREGDRGAREVLEEAVEEGVFLPGIWSMVTRKAEEVYTPGEGL
ncbi:hypothetical protein BZA05DRAFT_475813 [Tricharina praecox]|uniref:uncharacterized protein n=1 Tax=Tricharina praecox TaxID=43433 RepID=UPI00221EC631|nr:uncharacterized protein BZA05DRAFT_475813 [Tricharina praecox]KAI5847595.1 hypothetical protein BZA05DRAFT_475813 [Tricharina praecox]